ncbi:MAG: hypothetical protein KGI54_09655 [Pseudomonadota bacterium]|nr:hypothetical protein [Pseudomonadota bacterium]
MATNNSTNTATTSGTVIAGNGSSLVNLAYSSSGGTSNIVSRDSHGNCHANNFESKNTSNSATGTITLTNASSRIQVFSSGSGTATIVLPDATTLNNGHAFEFNNNASGNLTINANGGGNLTTMIPGSYLYIVLLSNSLAAGQWDYHWFMPSTAAYGTNGITVTGYINATTKLEINGNTLNAIAGWTDESSTFSPAVQSGYFVSGASTPVLPASPSQGDTISFIQDTSSTLTITGNTGQFLRIGSQLSVSAGVAVSTAQGNSVTFVYRSSDTTWIALSYIGTWAVT